MRKVRVVGTVSIGSFEVSRWRLRRMRCAMGIESILVLKALPEGDFGQDAVIDAHRISRYPSALSYLRRRSGNHHASAMLGA
jgi:hypothetical protein